MPQGGAAVLITDGGDDGVHGAGHGARAFREDPGGAILGFRKRIPVNPFKKVNGRGEGSQPRLPTKHPPRPGGD